MAKNPKRRRNSRWHQATTTKEANKSKAKRQTGSISTKKKNKNKKKMMMMKKKQITADWFLAFLFLGNADCWLSNYASKLIDMICITDSSSLLPRSTKDIPLLKSPATALWFIPFHSNWFSHCSFPVGAFVQSVHFEKDPQTSIKKKKCQ